ncbi:NAD-dependent epimerase/dehydratase family protein [Roseomonas sp. NAR14]|uniref:NAD-dependent epimerase/dehydratase family protein n=1 Tax=Roseomonas acroporae TaxID=2937791 RepID=A0A9X2BXV6_9PROT|nr:NAD-dependent epimerase/dehydratase family protein [Roseomonas acroporae]MCK8787676.1 NAD-dependent epimerase/dehydratase family protein [Roseomonas acroporae]
MRILVTGAAGFVGRALTRRLLAESRRPTVLAVDLTLPEGPADQRFVLLAGSITDPAVLARIAVTPPDVIYHLASVPGGAAEADYARGAEANVVALLRFLQSAAGWPSRPRFVFASSIAVFGTDFPALVDDGTPARPASTYGAQKRIGEILLADLIRRGDLRGCSVRLPGIVCRPPQRNGAVSIFMSDLIRDLPAGREVICPVPPEGTAWWMSIGCCVENLLRAASVDLPTGVDAYTLPPLRASIGQMVDILARRHGEAVRSHLRYQPDPAVTRLFAAYPPVHLPAAEAAGFRSDHDLDALLSSSDG